MGTKRPQKYLTYHLILNQVTIFPPPRKVRCNAIGVNKNIVDMLEPPPYSHALIYIIDKRNVKHEKKGEHT